MSVRRLFVVLLVALAFANEPTGTALAEDRRSSVSGTVYFDANGNGRPDSNERAVRNLQVDLEGSNGFKDSRKTGDNGVYEFSSLGAGRYRIFLRMPNGYGLSDGESGKEFSLDGRTPLRYVDFGVIRTDQGAAPPIAPQVAPPTTQPTPEAAAPAPRIAPPSSGNPPAAPAPPSASAPSSVPPVAVAPPAARQAPATATPVPQPTSPPRSVAPAAPVEPPTVVPTPTRTPPALEGQQVAAERARAALANPQPPRQGSDRGDGSATLEVPFRSALDGSEYADSNSGSAALGMALEAYGYQVTSADLRALANVLGRTYDVSQPPRLEMLVRVGEQAGLSGVGLFQAMRLALWTTDEVRDQVRQGYPVLTMINPPVGDAAAQGELGREHFILVVGFQENSFVYHDPAYPDERGSRRVMTANQLIKGWAESSGSGQAAGFALGSAQLGLFAPLDQLVLAQQPAGRPPEVREVPVPEVRQPLGGLGQLLPVPQPIDDASTLASGTMPGPSLHPMLLFFWLTAGVVLVRVVAALILG